MKYMGSKRRIAKHIIPIMVDAADEAGITTWIEPFVGGGNSIDKVPNRFKREGYDLNPHVIQAMLDIRDRPFDLLEEFTDYERKYIRELPFGVPLKSHAAIVTSFGADLMGGYARESGSDNSTFCLYGKRSAIKQSKLISDVYFKCISYDEISPNTALIYCDPPYKGTSGYKTGSFDHESFYKWCRRMAKENIVFVSEYSSPDDFVEVWRGEQKTNFSSKRNSATHNAIEKLFRVK